MEAPLGDSGVGLADDPLEPAQLHTGVGNPGQAGGPAVVATELLVPEFCDHLIPVGRVPKSARLDTTSVRPDEQSFAQITRAARAR